MSLVATLICNPNEPELNSTAIDAARSALPSPDHAEWLFEGVAADICFSSNDDFRTISDRLRSALSNLRVDVVVQSRTDRRKKLLLADNYLTVEPYALALPHGDEDFRLAVDRALSHLYREGQITAIFSQSFQQGTTPSGILKTLYLISGLPD